MSFAIPNATDYISFQRISDPASMMYGWVVVAVLETEFPQTVYVNNQQVSQMSKNVEFLVALPGKREDASLVSENNSLKIAAERAESEFKREKSKWEDEKKGLEDNITRLRNIEQSLSEARDSAFQKYKIEEKGNTVLRAEITRLKESMATVMLMISDNQKASVADLAEAQKVGDKMGEEPCNSK